MGKSGGARNEKNLVEVAVEAEFKTFMEGLKKKFGGNQLAYRVTNYPEGLEFSFRIAKKSGTEGDKFTSSFSQKGQMIKEKKELTEEQKKKLAEKRARKREKENQSPNIKREEKASSESDAKEKESEKDNL